uniref:G-protein coupled receptors family 1 profile domain-containing protein n=1 Tax=Biomphalaria glabrata TaxID=6526 RepID=A0A2C9L3J0_BIOGL
MDLQNSTVCQASFKIIGSNHVLVALSVLLVILAASTFLGNGAVLVAMVQTIRTQNDFQRSNSHSSHVTKLLMLSMTVSGVVVGALLMPLALLEFISNGIWTFGIFWLKFRVCADYLICCITSFHISFMAIDTYLLVCKPLLYRLLTLVVLDVIALVTFLTNGVVFVAIVPTVRKLDVVHSVRNHSNNSYITKMLILSMTISGVLVGGFLMPLASVSIISDGILGDSLFNVRVYADYLLCMITSFHITFMAIDTYLVVRKPLVYRRLSPRISYVVIALGWIIPTLIIVGPEQKLNKIGEKEIIERVREKESGDDTNSFMQPNECRHTKLCSQFCDSSYENRCFRNNAVSKVGN